MTPNTPRHGLLGIDIGGSFTDTVSTDASTGELRYGKTPTYPDDLVRSLRETIDEVQVPLDEISVLRHGTTVVINTILTSSGSKTALLTTRGFRDVLEIGRTNWPEPYNLFYDRLPPLVPRELRIELDERLASNGDIVQPLDESGVATIVKRLVDSGVASVAVCLLHSYVNPVHEQRVAEIIRETAPQLYVSLSHELSKEFREYERTSTAVTNAYVGDVVDEYISDFESHLSAHGFEGSLYLMESNGGVSTAEIARRKPVVMVESGPAAGAMATAEMSRQRGIDRAVAFDMGGTTAKACLIEEGEPLFTSQYYLPDYEHGFPLQVAALDIVEVGTGGGSIASVDDVGVLSVGPESAGAVPGPACYGNGGNKATVTDANLLLGRLNAHRFLDGSTVLDADASTEALGRLATQLGTDLSDLALGVIRLANFNMSAAIRRVSLERGRDPREFVLVAYGGAGPLHAVDLARDLSIPRVIVPVMPGIFSALGMLLADLRHDFTKTYLRNLEDLSKADLLAEYREIEAGAASWEDDVGSDTTSSRILRFADCRYRGQEFTIMVPVPDLGASDDLAAVRDSFEREYELRYGHSFPELPVETVNLRAVAYVGLPKPDLLTLADSARGGADSPEETRKVFFADHGFVESRVLDRRVLQIDQQLEGPVVIEEYGSTTIVGPTDRVTVDELRQLVIDVDAHDSTGE